MKKKTVAILLLVILTASVICYYLFRPTPIIKNINDAKITFIQYNDGANRGDHMVLIKDYDEKKILNYLSTCKERRTIEPAGSYMLGDVTFSIVLNTKDILLGNINYSYRGRGTPKYKIFNAEEVTKTLIGILNLDEKDTLKSRGLS